MMYLDNAATSYPKAPGVGEALFAEIADVSGNPGRGSRLLAGKADRLLFETREALARILGAGDPGRLAFTKNATEAINIVLLGLVREGSLVATSSLEHNAVMRPLRWLEESHGARVLAIPFDEAGRPDAESLADAVALKPDLAIFTMASNVTGAILPWGELAEKFGGVGSLVCLDGSQYLGHQPFAADAAKFDFLCFPGHKGLLGPTGTGGLYLAGEVLPDPLIRGGTGSRSSSERQPEELPDRFEAGTQNLSGAAGMLAAARYIESAGLEAIARRERSLTQRLLAGLRGIGGLKVFGPPEGVERTPIVSACAADFGLDEIARELDERGIAVRKGLQCAPAAHRSIGTLAGGGTIRFSPGFFNTEGEIDEAVRAMEEILGSR
jgi:cysteine desulfurase / selenocysteine lyase